MCVCMFVCVVGVRQGVEDVKLVQNAWGFGPALFLFVFTLTTCNVPLGSHCLRHNPRMCVAAGLPEPSKTS